MVCWFIWTKVLDLGTSEKLTFCPIKVFGLLGCVCVGGGGGLNNPLPSGIHYFILWIPLV